ncbi:MAG: hypothetical protein IPH97_03520 [Ignavibacteriales bacterium]|nr:hypothetical protein [Ignavibacteriales bacterium]
MKALITMNTCHNKFEESLIPTVKNPNDIIIRITKTTICEIDVHISKGDA